MPERSVLVASVYEVFPIFRILAAAAPFTASVMSFMLVGASAVTSLETPPTVTVSPAFILFFNAVIEAVSVIDTSLFPRSSTTVTPFNVLSVVSAEAVVIFAPLLIKSVVLVTAFVV